MPALEEGPVQFIVTIHLLIEQSRGDGVDGDAGIQLCLCAWPCPSRVEVMLLPRIMHRLSVVARLPADYAAQCQSA